MTVVFQLALVAGAIGVYVDAFRRRSHFPLLWALGSYLLCVIVIPLWFAVRPLYDGETRRGGRLHNAINVFGSLCVMFVMLGVTVEIARRIGLVVTGQRGVLRTLFGMWRFGFMNWVILGIAGFVFATLSALTNKADAIERGPTGRLGTATP